jgi:hypothetical protein
LKASKCLTCAHGTPDKCISCPKGHYKDGDVCKECNKAAKCNACKDFNTCTQCDNDYILT